MSYDFTVINEDIINIRKKFNNKFVILSLYIDDILIVKNDSEYIATIKEQLSSFKIKKMEKLYLFLELRF